MAKTSTTAWQAEVRKIMAREGVTWAQAKKIRAKGLKGTTAAKPVARKQRQARELTFATLESTQPTAIVFLVTKAEEFVNACGGDVTRAQEVLRTYQNLLPKETTTEQAVQDTRTLSSTKAGTNGSSATERTTTSK